MVIGRRNKLINSKFVFKFVFYVCLVEFFYSGVLCVERCDKPRQIAVRSMEMSSAN